MPVQEYEKINKPLLNFMEQMGSDSATISDSARAWLEIQHHFDNLPPGTHLRRITSTPAADLQQLQTLC